MTRSMIQPSLRHGCAATGQANRLPHPEPPSRGCHIRGLTGSGRARDRKSTRLNSSHLVISYAVFCLKKKNKYDARFDIIVPHSNILFAANEPLRADVPYQFQTGQDKSYSTSLHALNRSQAAGYYSVT